LTEIRTPKATADGDDTELRDDDGGTNGSGHFLRRLDAEADVTLRVANDDNGLESCPLTGTSLLLDGLDLRWESVVRDEPSRSGVG